MCSTWFMEMTGRVDSTFPVESHLIAQPRWSAKKCLYMPCLVKEGGRSTTSRSVYLSDSRTWSSSSELDPSSLTSSLVPTMNCHSRCSWQCMLTDVFKEHLEKLAHVRVSLIWHEPFQSMFDCLVVPENLIDPVPGVFTKSYQRSHDIPANKCVVCAKKDVHQLSLQFWQLVHILQPSKLQHDGVPTMWMDLLWHLMFFALQPHSLTTWAFIKNSTFFVSDNNQQQNLQIITHHGRLCTGPGPLWTSGVRLQI